MNFSNQPIDKWPRELTKHRRRSPFKTKLDASKRKLGYELTRREGRGDYVGGQRV